MATPHDLARELLGLARDDEAATRAMLAEATVTNAIVCFHAQQAIEKALKAVLASQEVLFPFTHDLEGLIELCEAEGLSLPTDLSEADRLSPYGVRLRYGGGDPGTVDRETALRLATSAIEFASAQIDAI